MFCKTHKINFDLALGVLVQAPKSEKEAAGADAPQVTLGNGMTVSNVSATLRLTIPLNGYLVVAYKFISSNSAYRPPDGVFW